MTTISANGLYQSHAKFSGTTFAIDRAIGEKLDRQGVGQAVRFKAYRESVAVPAPLHYGGGIPSGVNAHNEVLSEIDDLKKYGPINLDVSLGKLPRHFKRRAQRRMEQATPRAIREFNQQGKLGLLEESSDVMMEVYSLRAVQSGIISDAMIDELVAQLGSLPPDFIRRVEGFKQFISEDKVTAFQQLTGLKERKKVQKLLAILLLKFAQLTFEGTLKKPVVSETRKLLEKETEEFAEKLPPGPAVLLRLASRLTASRHLPAALFVATIKKMAEYYLDLGPVGHPTFLKYAMCKQAGRQELFMTAPGLGYEGRKKVLKPLETLYEVQLLSRVKRKNAPIA